MAVPHPHASFPPAAGRTYRYWRGEPPLFPFGFGLSYVQWRLSDAAFGAAGNGSSSGVGSGSGATGPLAAGESNAAELGRSVDLEGDSVEMEVSITVTHAGSTTNSSSGSGGSSASNVTASTSVLLFMQLLDGGAELAGGSNAGSNGTSGGPTSDLPLAAINGSGCSWSESSTDVVQQLVGYARTRQLAPGASQRLTFRLQLAPLAEGHNSSAAGSSSSSSGGSSWAGFGDPEPPCGLYGLRFGHDQAEAALVLLD